MFKAMALFTAIFFGQLAFAQGVMSPEKSKCLLAEQTAQKHLAWNDDFERFLNDYDGLDAQFKYDLMGKALKSIARHMSDFIQESGIKQPNSIRTRNAVMLIDQFDHHQLNLFAGSRQLKSTLIELNSDFQVMLQQADAKFPACDFTGTKSQRKAELVLPEASS